MDKSDSHWILYNEVPGMKNISSWRDYLKSHADKSQRKFVDDLSPELLYYIGWHVRRARSHRSSAGEYKSFLRSVGGAGDSDWYSTKAEMDYAAELEDLYLQKLERFAVGDLGARQQDFEKFVNSHRKQYEERVRLGIIEE